MTASAPRTNPISRLDSPARTYRCRRFACALTGADARLTATVGRYSFGAGLSHSHLTAGLSRRTMTRGRRGSLALRRRALPSPPPCRFIPALSHDHQMVDEREAERIMVQGWQDEGSRSES